MIALAAGLSGQQSPRLDPSGGGWSRTCSCAALSKAIGLITFPLLARHLSTENYGVFDYLLVLSAFLTILIVFGQDSAVARYYYEHEQTE